MLGAIELTGLSHRYADGRVALSGVRLSIAPGERVGLVGGNGAGKTTLLLRLAGVLPGRAGEGLVCGLDPAVPADRDRLPRHVGVVFQSPDDQIIAMTVKDDVMFGPLHLGTGRAEAERRAEAAMRDLGLAELAGVSPERLSGGEKRKLALAGALAAGPSVVLLDEPTTFLDARGRGELARVLASVAATAVVASHDLGFLRRACPRWAVLDAGRCVADGPAELLLSQEGLLRDCGVWDGGGF